MKDPIRMYKLRPIINHDCPVALPDCMYKLRSIHNSSRTSIVENNQSHHVPSSSGTNLDIFDQNNQKLSGMAALEVKQEQILMQLADLKKQMSNIRKQLRLNDHGPIPIPQSIQQNKISQQQLNNLAEVVINANPSNPPYSLELVQKLWQNYVEISIKSYLHSTVAKLDDNAAALVKNLENFKATGQQVPKVNLKLIWKNIGADTELIISKTPILGEPNILRFLARLSPNHLNYETFGNPYEIDNLLDVAYKIIQSKTKTERAALLRTVNKSVGESLWLVGRNEVSVADIAIYSAIKQSCSATEINANLSKWLSRCSAL